MANTNNWGEIYNSTWWGDEDWSANSLKIDSAPPGFAGQNLLLGSEELEQSDEGEWERLNINAVDANVSGVANPLSSDETVEKVDFQASPTSRIIQDVTLVAGTQYTFSVWAKSAGASNEQFRLRYWDRTASSGGGDLFTALTTDWDATSGRYSFTFTAASSGVHAMHIQNSGSVQRRIYFWGAMLNEGATAGDYIKTEFTPQPSNPPTPPMEFGDNFVGVTAYYSLRRFTTGEDNNAIRVRRSSDDTEQDIGFDANGDLDSTALLAFVGTGGTDNGFVSKWYDQSGNGNDAINADASEQPLIVSGGALVEENGKAAVDFDGVDDYLQNTSLVSSTPTTHYLTAKANPKSTTQRLSDGGVSSSTRHSIYQNASRFQYFGGVTLTGDSEDANQNLHYFLANGTSSEIAINGATASVGNAGTNTLNGLTFAARWDGAAQWGDVSIQELIIFDSNQSGIRTDIESNINDHFSIFEP